MPKELIKVVLVDDHPRVRGGLRLLIESQPDMRVMADTGVGAEAIPLCSRYCPDVILLDLSLSDESGFQVLRQLKESTCKARVLVLTMQGDSSYRDEVARLGGDGLVSKKAADEELLAAIRSLFP